MFDRRTAFNQDISSWDVSNVTDMDGMFYGFSFNQDISSWDVSSVTDMRYMFYTSAFNQDLSTWSVDDVTSCGNFSNDSPLTEANTPNFTNLYSLTFISQNKMKKLSYLFLALLMLSCTTDDNNNVDNSNTLEKEWLYTHTALEATATSSTTIVMPFTEDIFAFTDRPNREHKYISGDEFASYWNDYDDENSFKLDPPNAVLTWVDADGVSEVEVVITDANFDGNNVIYTIENTTITANQSFEDVSLFVDGNGSSNAVYLASNGVTVKASAGAVNGDTGVGNGVTCTVVNLSTLNSMISKEMMLPKWCTSLITDMSYML